MMGSTAIVWFRRDLRLADNPAWAAATHAADTVVPLLVIEPGLLDRAGPHRRHAFLDAVAALDESLSLLGGRLHVRIGNPIDLLPAVVDQHDAVAVFANADVSRWAQRRDNAVAHAVDVPVEWHWGTLVHAPGTVLTKAGTISKVFTPFSKQWFAVTTRPEGECRLQG